MLNRSCFTRKFHANVVLLLLLFYHKAFRYAQGRILKPRTI